MEDASLVDADSGGGIYRVASASFCARHPSAWSWLVQSGELLDDASRCPSAKSSDMTHLQDSEILGHGALALEWAHLVRNRISNWISTVGAQHEGHDASLQGGRILGVLLTMSNI